MAAHSPGAARPARDTGLARVGRRCANTAPAIGLFRRRARRPCVHRAMIRAGELMLEIKAQRAGRPSKIKSRVGPNLRKQAAPDAGLTPKQAKTAIAPSRQAASVGGYRRAGSSLALDTRRARLCALCGHALTRRGGLAGRGSRRRWSGRRPGSGAASNLRRPRAGQRDSAPTSSRSGSGNCWRRWSTARASGRRKTRPEPGRVSLQPTSARSASTRTAPTSASVSRRNGRPGRIRGRFIDGFRTRGRRPLRHLARLVETVPARDNFSTVSRASEFVALPAIVCR